MGSGFEMTRAAEWLAGRARAVPLTYASPSRRVAVEPSPAYSALSSSGIIQIT